MSEEGGVGKQGRTETVVAPVFVDDEGHPVLGDVDPNEVEQIAADFATIVRRVGGVCIFGAHRIEVEPGVFQTERVVFEWSSRAPAQRLPQEEAKPEPEPEQRDQLAEDVDEGKPEPVAAE